MPILYSKICGLTALQKLSKHYKYC